MFADVIALLLEKKQTLREEIEREFAARSAKIDDLLERAGYVEPEEVVVAEPVEAEVVPAEVVPQEVSVQTNAQIIY